MSIIARVEELVAVGKLIHRPSSFLDISARNVILAPEIEALAQKPFADTPEGERHAALAAYLDAFSELNAITVSQDPYNKPGHTMLARAFPIEDEFWSMRITHPEDTAGMRLLGAFCAVDSFVGLACDFRENIMSFDDEVSAAKDRWADLFNGITPLSGSSLRDYLTNFREL